MNDERDSQLRDLFAAAEQNLEDEAFVAHVMTRASTLGRRRVILLLAFAAAVMPAIWLIGGPLNGVLLGFLDLIARPMTTTGGWLGTVLSPLNSLASVLALGLLAGCTFYRRLVGQ